VNLNAVGLSSRVPTNAANLSCPVLGRPYGAGPFAASTALGRRPIDSSN